MGGTAHIPVCRSACRSGGCCSQTTAYTQLYHRPMAARMQAMGASVSMRRIMTPAKYQAKVPYRMRKTAPSLGFCFRGSVDGVGNTRGGVSVRDGKNTKRGVMCACMYECMCVKEKGADMDTCVCTCMNVNVPGRGSRAPRGRRAPGCAGRRRRTSMLWAGALLFGRVMVRGGLFKREGQCEYASCLGSDLLSPPKQSCVYAYGGILVRCPPFCHAPDTEAMMGMYLVA